MSSDSKNTSTLRNIGNKLTEIYWVIGAISIGLLAFFVVFTVVMRYFFSLNWKQVAEFIVTLFAFSTFWGLGFCVLKDEHVIIDSVYDVLPVKVKRVLKVINYIIMATVMIIFVVYGISYVKMAGIQLSLGMQIPMYYMYGIMPITGVLCIICIAIKIIETIKAPDSEFARKHAKLREGGND